ncbi:50S ribosome-binding GTPase [Dehalococcoidia bacterium]|nr:50S ribosome-binding GTPase [Dehalococcoidia bacterium]
MPANLTPQYFEAEKRYRSAETPDERIAALQEMLSVMPKHKGTDGLRAELRTKIAKLSKEAAKAQATARRGGMYHIPREGAGQVVLVGLPNVGKSQLVSAVTEASLEVADYPFTTKAPQLGMMKFENVQIQLVDMPPITDHNARPWFASVLRSANAILLVVDLADDPVKQANDTLAELEKFRVGLVGNRKASDQVMFQKRGIVVGTKNDLDGSASNYADLKARYGDHIAVISISAEKGTGLEGLRKDAFDLLEVVRVYTKAPGERTNMDDPMIMRKGSTVEDAAEGVHKDFRKGLKYALIWGSGKFAGQRVKKDHVLKDGDIIELHT